MKLLLLFIFSALNPLAAQTIQAPPDVASILKQHCLICNNKGDAAGSSQYLPFHNMHKCFEEKNYAKLLPAILNATNYYEKTPSNATLLCLTYCVKGSFYRKNALYKEALTALLKARQIALKLKEQPAKVYLYADIAIVLFELKDYMQALQFYKELESMTKGFEDNRLMKAGTYNNEARCYKNITIPDFAKAEGYYKQSINLYQELKDSLNMATVNLNLGDLYFEQYKDDLAIKHLQEALKYAKKLNAVDILDDIYFNLSLAMESKGNTKMALAYYKNYIAIQENIWNRDKLWKLAQQEKKFIVNKKETEIRLLEKDAKLQKALLQTKRTERNTFFSAAAALLLLLVISVFAYRQSIAKNKVIGLQNKELDDLNRTKDRLFSIVAHDLKSPVFMLKEANLKLQKGLLLKDYKSVDGLLQTNIAMTENTYSMLDNLLYWAIDQNKNLSFNNEILPLHNIIEQVCSNYLPAMQHKDITFIKNIPADLWVNADINALKITVRNLMDNAIRFTHKGGEIKISALTKGTSVELLIQDTGIGMSQIVLQSLFNQHHAQRQKDTNGRLGTGLGLELCKTMTEKNGGKLSIDSNPNQGTRICITLVKAKNGKYA